MKKIINTIFALIILPSLFLAGCGSASDSNSSREGLKVLASTSFLADIAQNVAGDRAQVEALIPMGFDPHAYQAAPSDVAKIAQSEVLILNGVEYEHFIEPLLENAGGERVIVESAAGIEPRQMDDHMDDHMEEHADHDHAAGDPHMWLDPTLVIRYVENIRDGLIQADPDGANTYTANAEAYTEQLQELDAYIQEQLEALPVERRLLVTNHGAMGYFAERYGFEVVDTILPSFSSEADASAQEIVATVDAIKSSGASAIFLGEVENPDLAEQIAAETGVRIVDDLYLETLTEGGPASTYLDMMKHNVTQIVDALK